MQILSLSFQFECHLLQVLPSLGFFCQTGCSVRVDYSSSNCHFARVTTFSTVNWVSGLLKAAMSWNRDRSCSPNQSQSSEPNLIGRHYPALEGEPCERQPQEGEWRRGGGRRRHHHRRQRSLRGLRLGGIGRHSRPVRGRGRRDYHRGRAGPRLDGRAPQGTVCISRRKLFESFEVYGTEPDPHAFPRLSYVGQLYFERPIMTSYLDLKSATSITLPLQFWRPLRP